jgi:transposase-like protein
MQSSSHQDDNLKEHATRQIIELGCTIEDVAKSTGICELTLYRWTQEYIKSSAFNNQP